MYPAFSAVKNSSGEWIDTTMINKKKIKKSFNVHARSYDQSAHLQQKVAGEVIERVRALGIHPTHILDVGTGTGYVALALKKLFSDATSQACDIAHGMVIVAKAKGKNFLVTALTL